MGHTEDCIAGYEYKVHGFQYKGSAIVQHSKRQTVAPNHRVSQRSHFVITCCIYATFVAVS